jgi:hypothetical protein
MRKYVSEKGQVLNYVTVVAAGLRRELGDTHQAIKTVMKWTGANERTVKNWLGGRYGPNGEHLIDLFRNFGRGARRLPSFGWAGGAYRRERVGRCAQGARRSANANRSAHEGDDPRALKHASRVSTTESESRRRRGSESVIGVDSQGIIGGQDGAPGTEGH